MKKLHRMFSSLTAAAIVLMLPVIALAEDGAAQGIAQKGDGGWIAIAIALGIGMAAFGGALGQSRAASAALEGISRNPNAADKVFVPMLLGLAFIESLVLFTWVLMLLMLLKL
ncbi:MAG: ATP synthase F0 subunit C [Myxococcota bacterium]